MNNLLNRHKINRLRTLNRLLTTQDKTKPTTSRLKGNYIRASEEIVLIRSQCNLATNWWWSTYKVLSLNSWKNICRICVQALGRSPTHFQGVCRRLLRPWKFVQLLEILKCSVCQSEIPAYKPTSCSWGQFIVNGELHTWCQRERELTSQRQLTGQTGQPGLSHQFMCFHVNPINSCVSMRIPSILSPELWHQLMDRIDQLFCAGGCPATLVSKQWLEFLSK